MQATRLSHLKTAMHHYLRKKAPQNTGWGAVAGALYSIGEDVGFNQRMGLTQAIHGRYVALFALKGAVIANAIGGGYRFIRTACRNPASVETQAQIIKWERDLAETPSLRERLARLAFWKKAK